MNDREKRIPPDNKGSGDAACVESRTAEKLRQAVLDARCDSAWTRVGGIPLVARSLWHLNKLGIEEVILLVDSGGRSTELGKWRGRLSLREWRADRGAPVAPALLAVLSLAPRFLFLDCAHLMDPRIMAALSAAQAPTLACVDGDPEEGCAVRAGTLSIEDLETWAAKGPAALFRCSARLYPGDVDPFSPEIRGCRTPYFMEVRTADDAEKATRLLIRSQQKFVMDLPAEYIDPHFEDPLTHRLCGTFVTPNMVTMLGVLVAALIVTLFWHGHFVAGALLMFAVEILDGVDGKLARTTLHYTRLGHHEDVIDYFCETMIYVGLGVGLTARYGGNLPCVMTALLIVSDTVDNTLYTLAGKWHGKSIDLFSPFDGAFRLIGGRRNIYGAMFIVGFIAGHPLPTLVLTAAWAAVTAAVHGVRLYQYGRAGARLSR